MQNVDSKRLNQNMSPYTQRRTERPDGSMSHRRQRSREIYFNLVVSILLAVCLLGMAVLGFFLGWYNTATWIGPGFDFGRDWPTCTVVGLIVAVVFCTFFIYVMMTHDDSDSES